MRRIPDYANTTKVAAEHSDAQRLTAFEVV
jgi:hypothetical protein